MRKFVYITPCLVYQLIIHSVDQKFYFILLYFLVFFSISICSCYLNEKMEKIVREKQRKYKESTKIESFVFYGVYYCKFL